MAKKNMLASVLVENARLKAENEELRILANARTESITKETEDVCPKVYAAILYVLKHHYRFNSQKLMNVLDESYEVWQTTINKQENLLEWVENETGIRLSFGGYEDGD